MKNTLLKLTLLASTFAPTLHATNGDNFIALGVASRGMGGTGIAHYSAGASATGNPALITQAKGGEFTFGGTYLDPDVQVETSNTQPYSNDQKAYSKSKKSTTPYAALTHNLGNGFSVGGSMYGVAGMGTDWTSYAPITNDQQRLYSMKSSLTMLKISAPVAYSFDNLSIGIAPVMLFGTLDMSFQARDPSDNLFEVGTSEQPSSDTGFGYELGALYQFKSVGINLGVVYHSSISMTYDDQLSVISAGFGYGSAGSNFPIFSDDLEQPAELGFGVDWTYDMISISADYRELYWGSAAGYREFNWDDQQVYALGVEVRIDDLALRAGYNYGENPIQESSDTTNVHPLFLPEHGDVINTFNHVMFPAVTEKHYTLGAGYQFSGGVSADLAIVYATSPSVSVQAETTKLGTVTVTNDQIAVSAALNIVF